MLQKIAIRLLLLVFTAVFVIAHPIPAAAAEVSGYAGVEARVFPDDPIHAGQEHGAAFSFLIEPEIYHPFGDTGLTLVAKPFLRYDESDPERSHFDLRELAVHKVAADWELKAGLSKVFWGVTESRHLVDIINQTDGVEDIDGEDKLGQPMVQFTGIRPRGALAPLSRG